ncbi:DUF3426 domain-containing protein [Desulfoplanes formicivorans]|uniref:Zinc finger/thioredoxin putative domain-containing protein n=1 Tax=Desulfoplanes formicivorans TaxID=1592317 RepID=A0A194AHK4_9BACT|nr:DUF3426 domain-containing protein [Desulfoplanes formicivorans]GAU08239.1 hypothetical protein DPF_0942 [Desulfoplanes formicivorans]
MIVQCPECDTRYNLDEDRIGPQGSKVRCTRCKHVFRVARPVASSVEETVEQLFSQAPDVFDNAADAPEGLEPPASKESEQPVDEHDVPVKKGRARQIVLWLLLVVLIVIGVGIGTYYYAPQLLDNTGTGAFVGKKVEEQKKETEAVIPEIALENVRQYFVKNEKIGQVFVVEGKAVNKFDVPKELIKLRIKLFDDTGKVIENKEFLCGNVVSYFQLQVLQREELESALTAKVGILTNNTNLKPGAGVPFMVVFPNPPKTLSEFALEPIEVKDPPA